MPFSVADIVALIGSLATLITAIILIARAKAEIANTFAARDETHAKTEFTTAQIISELQEQIGVATKAEGDLREELQRLHKKDEEQQTEIINLHRENAAFAETNATLSDINASLLLERRQLAAENATLQKRLIDKETEKQAMNKLILEMQSELDILRGKMVKVEAATGEFRRVTNELQKK